MRCGYFFNISQNCNVTLVCHLVVKGLKILIVDRVIKQCLCNRWGTMKTLSVYALLIILASLTRAKPIAKRKHSKLQDKPKEGAYKDKQFRSHFQQHFVLK